MARTSLPIAVVAPVLVSALASALFFGCAEATPDEAAKKDALVSDPTMNGERLDADLSDPGDLGDATPPVLDKPDGTTDLPPLPDAGEPPVGCEPGEPLGLCSVCGADRVPAQPADDVDCPPVNCAIVMLFERAQEGDATLCNRVTATPGASRCKALGQCHDSPAEYCETAGAPTEVARATGPCQQLEGCLGEAAPTVMNLAAGTPCEGGLCDGAGVCEPEANCEIFAQSPAAIEFCGEGNDGFVDYCEYYVNPPGNQEMNCAEFCALQGEVCIAAFADTDSDCRRGGDENCGENFEDHVCRCERP